MGMEWFVGQVGGASIGAWSRRPFLHPTLPTDHSHLDMPSFRLMVPGSTMARRRRPVEIASMITICQPTAQTHSALAKIKALWEGLVGVAELDERTDDECVVHY